MLLKINIQESVHRIVFSCCRHAEFAAARLEARRVVRRDRPEADFRRSHGSPWSIQARSAPISCGVNLLPFFGMTSSGSQARHQIDEMLPALLPGTTAGPDLPLSTRFAVSRSEIRLGLRPRPWQRMQLASKIGLIWRQNRRDRWWGRQGLDLLRRQRPTLALPRATSGNTAIHVRLIEIAILTYLRRKGIPFRSNLLGGRILINASASLRVQIRLQIFVRHRCFPPRLAGTSIFAIQSNAFKTVLRKFSLPQFL